MTSGAADELITEACLAFELARLIDTPTLSETKLLETAFTVPREEVDREVLHQRRIN